MCILLSHWNLLRCFESRFCLVVSFVIAFYAYEYKNMHTKKKIYSFIVIMFISIENRFDLVSWSSITKKFLTFSFLSNLNDKFT